MSVKFNHDTDDIQRQINSLYSQIASGYNDGFVQWGCKKDLHRIKFQIDNLLNQCPTFAGEDKWLEEQAKLQTWDKLKQ